MADDIYSIAARTLEGEDTTLERYRGKVLLVVNTASQCGFTPQYEGLENLYEKYHGEGLEVLGFPCNQFGRQEPGTSSDIQDFCTVRFGVTFPLHERVDVNGAGEHPLFTLLKNAAPGVLGSKNIKWNFTKFLVGRDGKVLSRFGSTTKPESIESQIRKALEA
jgi:glutathione peroxidase